MSPNKSIEAQIDEMIETDIDFWTESKEREAVQEELFEETE